MMEDYIKAENQLEREKDKLNERLKKVLEANNIKTHLAGFNFYKNQTIIWGQCNVPKKILDELEKEFGEIQCVYNTHNSNTLFIKFKGGEE